MATKQGPIDPQWSSTTKGAPFFRSKDDGYVYPSCSVCKGVKPSAQAEKDFYLNAIGHKSDCKYYS
jgi:hypothetical protein